MFSCGERKLHSEKKHYVFCVDGGNMIKAAADTHKFREECGCMRIQPYVFAVCLLCVGCDDARPQACVPQVISMHATLLHDVVSHAFEVSTVHKGLILTQSSAKQVASSYKLSSAATRSRWPYV